MEQHQRSPALPSNWLSGKAILKTIVVKYFKNKKATVKQANHFWLILYLLAGWWEFHFIFAFVSKLCFIYI